MGTYFIPADLTMSELKDSIEAHGCWVVMAHAFNPRAQEAETGGSLEFEANLVYRPNSRTAKTSQRNFVLKNFFKKKSMVYD